MDGDSRISIFIVVILFIASAYFALTETALASVSRNRIRIRVEKGDTRAKRVLYALDHFDDAITTLLILTNIAHIAAAAIITVLVTRKWGLSAVTLSTVLATIAMFFLGEMLPKSIGKKRSESVSLACCGMLSLLMKLCWPIAKVLGGIGNITLKAMKGEEETTVTEDELYDIIEDMAEEGSIDEDQSDLISSALQFADVTVSSILTPRVDVAALDLEADPQKVLSFIQSQNHSRILVYKDTIDNIAGILQIRRFLKEYISTGQIPSLKGLLDEPYFIPQSMPIDELLEDMSKMKLNMAVVTDSYGGTLGIVTVEDILEEIVGEIWDEDDIIHESMTQISKNTYMIDADETVEDTFEFIGFENPETDEDDRFTNLLMADWVFEEFTAIPEKGDSFDFHELTVKVEEISHNRILKVSVTVNETAVGKEEEE